jgi:putative phosphoribosyl transferase
MPRTAHSPVVDEEVQIRVGSLTLAGNLSIPDASSGIVLFAHGSGSGRFSSRNRFVAGRLQEANLATLLMDLLTEEEESIDRYTAHLRFDIGLLADRLVGATDWVSHDPRTADMAVGYFGASTGGGAALVAASRRPGRIAAVVSRGGRPDLAAEALGKVRAPTLLIVGGDDEVVIDLNESALRELSAPVKQLKIVPGASHLFEEPGKLEEVSRLAADWFARHLHWPEEPLAA